ncbi:Orotate phosphoribosyltransferase [Candidatus Nitrosocosmicus oleophilus]|uniref:Orotate phosphoribosyltransferase n=1 Tax=Candidatus Nitrosocosmicus oleophilus TaxID=1353260 RepID=A0A654M1T6_9ARCH|nr:orotate phosphoribosyltransferase [Candidatus Nitrosocosmicus oleophilus]ALI36459.1 Orotate phosphoribosyltransferase [Candidatus Nitrosocosmicus oleophilus]
MNENDKIQLEEDLILFLFDKNAIKIGNFTLSSGRKSRFYLDLRILQSYPLYFRKTISLLKTLIHSQIGLESFDYLCSVPTSGTVFGSALSYELFKPHIYVRKDLKNYGTQKKIEGALEPNSKILFVDDVITTGQSILTAVESLSNNSVVSGVVVLIDRQQGSQNLFDQFTLKIKSAITIHRIIDILNDNARINKNEYDRIKEELVES